ncbi:hypothetical protein [Candidatus Odyssella thessalonicensis]|uniref:hypothetical protein n=1 Tax=Candidatus Odyssella thessalonicensis TaxID=84647 RepID=UPI000225AF9E|nr:hypothetical protein [Candidatus Odyssella thessalonicensis]
MLSATAIDDFSQQEQQAKAADETCVRSEAELEATLDQWEDLREEGQALQKGQYRLGNGDTASTAEDLSGLFFDAATRDQRIANIQARKAMEDKTRQLLVEHHTAHTTFEQLAQQPHLIVKPTERRFDIIERAKQALASHTAPDLAQVSGYAASSSSSSTPSVMMASLAATATTAGQIMQGAMPRFAAATAGGAPAMFELAAAGFGKVPLHPNTLMIGAAATALTYGAYKGYEWYQDCERAKESQTAAEHEDLKQAYESSRSQQGQAWLQRHTYTLAAADTAVAGVYNPSTDKGKEKLIGSEFIENAAALERSASAHNPDIFIKQASNTGSTRSSSSINQRSSSSSSLPPDWEPDDHEGDKWKKNNKDRWHNDQAKDKDWVPNRPNFENKKLQDTANELYRDKDMYPGGSAGALRREIVQNMERTHLEKCEGRLRRIQRILQDGNEKISRLDRQAAERLVRDLREAIEMAKGK